MNISVTNEAEYSPNMVYFTKILLLEMIIDRKVVYYRI